MSALNHVSLEPAGQSRSRVDSGFDVYALREDFPILKQLVHGKKLVYLDNAATTQKPRPVIDALACFYCADCSNIHRGVHALSERATQEYENTREIVRDFINAERLTEVILVRGTTEAINLVASTYGRKNFTEGDEIIISAMEHHSNIVPWQIVCEQTGAKLRVIPINDRGELVMEEYEKLLGPKTTFVAVTQMSNALGTINPVREIIEKAHAWNALVMVDGAQGIAHLGVDVRELDADFYAFSGHKIYGPTGVGVLYGKEKLLEDMPPYQGGGDMIRSVTFEKTLYAKLPAKFEAGTPNISGGIGLGAAIKYVTQVGLENIAAHEAALLERATEAVQQIPGVKLIGTAEKKASVLSFTLEQAHPHDIGTILDQEGVAIRTGHHCAQPVMQRFGVPATARASFALYNTFEEVDALTSALHKVHEVFA
ncbi:MAG TPA: cysteine desulfurase [Terriglobales bacterium]|nr:cysteine desulfurase [Terriglobales bacterium]